MGQDAAYGRRGRALTVVGGMGWQRDNAVSTGVLGLGRFLDMLHCFALFLAPNQVRMDFYHMWGDDIAES